MNWYKKAQEEDDQEDLRAAIEEVSHDDREAFTRKVSQDAWNLAYTSYFLPDKIERAIIFKEVADLIYKSKATGIKAAEDIAALAKISYILKENYGSMIWVLRNWGLPVLGTFLILVKDQVVKDKDSLEKAISLFDKWVLDTSLSHLRPQEVAQLIKNQIK